MPRFEAPPPRDPIVPYRPAVQGPTPPFEAFPTWPATPRPAPLGVMTRGWAWTALLLMSLLPIGIVCLVVAYVVGSMAPADAGPEEDEAAWLTVAAGYAFLLWLLLSTVGAFLSAVIGAVRARRHPGVPRAPIVSVVVWSSLALGTFLLVRAIVTSSL